MQAVSAANTDEAVRGVPSHAKSAVCGWQVAQCCSDRAMHSQKGRGGAEAYNMRNMGMNSYHVYQTDRPQEAPVS